MFSFVCFLNMSYYIWNVWMQLKIPRKCHLLQSERYFWAKFSRYAPRQLMVALRLDSGPVAIHCPVFIYSKIRHFPPATKNPGYWVAWDVFFEIIFFFNRIWGEIKTKLVNNDVDVMEGIVRCYFMDRFGPPIEEGLDTPLFPFE